MSDSLSDRVRRRLREEMQRQNLNQSDVAGRLDWTQTRVSKVLNGKIQLGVDEMDALCFAVGLQPTEVVRDHGLEFCAEMTPTELRVLERLRALAPHVRDAVLTLLDIKAARTVEDRGVLPKKPAIPRGRSNGTV